MLKLYFWINRKAMAAMLALMVPGWAIGAEIEVKTSHSGDVVSVRAQATIAAPIEVVWATLTDYERLPEFVPGLKKSKVIARNGNTAVVQQSGEARFFFTSVPIEVTLESSENPPNSIDVRRVSGSIKRLDGRYETQVIEGVPSQVVLRWIGMIEPENGLPPLIGEALMRRSIRQQFAGMVGEIERREALRQQSLMPPAPSTASSATK
jgi:ribosome-associated toxin RatA of RatAB toxin-antitoxin module